jgi:hypothetical protein
MVWRAQRSYVGACHCAGQQGRGSTCPRARCVPISSLFRRSSLAPPLESNSVGHCHSQRWEMGHGRATAPRRVVIGERTLCVQGELTIGLGIYLFSAAVTTACTKRTGAAASVKRRRRESARAISPERLARSRVKPLSSCGRPVVVESRLSLTCGFLFCCMLTDY